MTVNIHVKHAKTPDSTVNIERCRPPSKRLLPPFYLISFVPFTNPKKPPRKDTSLERILEYMENITQKFAAWEDRMRQREREFEDAFNQKLVDLNDRMEKHIKLLESSAHHCTQGLHC